jgi:hypothetical protein
MDFFGFENKKKVEEDRKDHGKNDEERQGLKKDQDNKNYDNYNLEEGREEKIENQLGDSERLENTYMRRIEFDMSESKKQLKMKLEDKNEMEMMRRWQIKIYNIYITPLMEMIDPFVQFTIGGDFSVQVYSNKKGQSYKVPKGKRGFADKTEVQTNVDKLERRPFDKIIDIEMRMSYSMVNNQKLMIEIWDYNTIWMNSIKCYMTIPLMDIINGNCNITEDVTRKQSGRRNPVPYARIDFKCTFQEIWDFKLTFFNWKSGSVFPPMKRKKIEQNVETYPSTQIEIELAEGSWMASNNRVVSEICKQSATPMWSNFTGCIVFRGTMSMLESQSFIATLIDRSGLIFRKVLSTKMVSLKGLLDSERIKSEFTMISPETKEKYYTPFEGIVNVDHRIKFKQSGENVVLLSTKKYLCISIMRVENIRPAETRGIVDSFISAEWCGLVQRTRTIKENNNPIFNEILYFQVPFPAEYVQYPEKYVQKINEEFATKNEILFSLMIEGDDNTYDNLGVCYFHLSDIKDGERQEKRYFADDLKKDKRCISRIFTGKSKMTSAFSLSNNTFVHYEAWFLDDFPPVVDFGEKKKKSELGDKVPIELQQYFENGNDILLETLFKRTITNIFMKYSNYSYKDRCFLLTKQIDQYKNSHLLPYFLSQITLPEKLYSKDDVLKNPNFFDCNLHSLDEVAHYTRCYAFPTDNKADVWTSPDFMLKIRKGDIDDHAILMASMMMGLKKSKSKIKSYEFEYDEQTKTPNDKTTTGMTSTNSKTPTNTGSPSPDMIITEIEERHVFPYENRVFVCIGKLKYTKAPHMWVMTFSDDFRDVSFWEPKMFDKFLLKGRVDDQQKLRNFLNGKYSDYDSVKRGKVIVEEDEKSSSSEESEHKDKKKDWEDRQPKGMNENDVIAYKDEEDNYIDFIRHEKEIILGDFEQLGNNDEVIKKKFALKEQIDDNLVYEKDAKRNKYDYLEDQKQVMEEKMKEGNDVNFLPIEDFKDRTGASLPSVALPYETIDLIFNRNNIFANKQFHDPAHIKYNVYDREQWLPYVSLKDNIIWRGKFEPFYSLTNFGPVLSPGLINKMNESLIKEVRIGITAARSGMNLQTKFKKKNEHINGILKKYCDYIEQKALSRITDR